ncbi:hypothetical protein [Kitasatospora sp. NPDC004272]
MILTDLSAVLAELAWGTLGPKPLMTEARSGPSAQALVRTADLARRTANARASAVPAKIQTEAKDLGLVVHLYTRPAFDADTAEWPAVELAVGAELSDLTQWLAVAEQLSTLLHDDPGSEGYRRPVLLVPLIDGKPVRLLARQLQSTLWPGTGLFDTWETTLPEAHPTPLTDALIEGHQALQCLSGLAYLATLRDADPRHQDVADHARGQFQQAHRAIMALRPGDLVVGEIADFLAALARRVGSENAEGANCRETGAPNLAASIAQGGTRQPTDDFLQLDGLITLALQWDLDPGHAAQRLAGASS